MQPVASFEDIQLADVVSVGGKGANLGELVAADLPVPPGFVVTAEGYLDAIDRAGVRDKLRKVLADAATADDAALTRASELPATLITSTPIPAEIATAVVQAYHRLGATVSVAVRSSGISEDSGASSSPG